MFKSLAFSLHTLFDYSEICFLDVKNRLITFSQNLPLRRLNIVKRNNRLRGK